MKARIKATGEIIEVYFYGKEGYDYVCNDKEECYERGELEILDEPDYWTRLEHQYAGMAMQGILANEGTKVKKYLPQEAKDIALALVEKMKEERK